MESGIIDKSRRASRSAFFFALFLRATEQGTQDSIPLLNRLMSRFLSRREIVNEILTHPMARAKSKPSPKETKPKSQGTEAKKPVIEKLAFVVHSLTLTRADEDILEHLSGDITDYTGRKISGSAVLRALLRYTNQQGYQWFLSQVSPFIEAEISSGVVWGKKK
jgi:hypothetical protein